MSEEAGSAIKSVARVFEVLELFERLRTPLTSVRVGRSLNYPASSALALLKSMVSLGYLSFDRIDRTYFPTLRLPLISQWVERAVHIGDTGLVAAVEAMIQATGESVSVSSQNDLAMQFIYIAQGPQHITVNLTAGALAPLFQSSVGLTGLSIRSDDEILRLAGRFNGKLKDKTQRVDPAEILATIEAIRRRGWFAGYDMYIQGVGAISWALPTRDGRGGMVLAVSGPSDRIRRHEARIVGLVGPILRDLGFVSADQPPRRV